VNRVKKKKYFGSNGMADYILLEFCRDHRTDLSVASSVIIGPLIEKKAEKGSLFRGVNHFEKCV